ncbi:MAG: hypothetical protein PHO32_10670, partial [Candidatus Cloacimonetes bacterium]|nr:hypothetical protein [Candidatus Cloacimonadota bacterium]
MKYLICLLLFCFAQICNAIVVPFSSEMIKTDTNRISGMQRIFPADQQALDLSTDCWIWHDGKNLFLYWEMGIDDSFEPGAFATRDDVQASDYVRLQLKTIANEDFAYYFSAFPRGSAFDAIRTETLQVDKAWNSFYDCTSSYNESLWTVVMTIPFRDLRFEGTPPYQWSFGLARQVQDTNSSYSNPFSPLANRTPRQYFDSFEPLIINEKIDSPKSFYAIPYFYKSYDFLTEEDSFVPKHVGLNLVYRPSTNSSVKVAFN